VAHSQIIGQNWDRPGQSWSGTEQFSGLPPRNKIAHMGTKPRVQNCLGVIAELQSNIDQTLRRSEAKKKKECIFR